MCFIQYNKRVHGVYRIMRKIIDMSDIRAVAGISKKPVGNQLFEHGGYGQGQESGEFLKKHGFMLVPYETGMKIQEDDVILYSDREHFYEGWKILRRTGGGYLHNTLCVMIESGAVDKKCAEKTLRKIKNAFPVILSYHDDLTDNCKFFKYCPSINSSTIMEKRNIPYEKMNLGVIVCTNKNPTRAVDKGELYSERRKIISFFEKNKQHSFCLYGCDWHGYSNWKGTMYSKSKIYSDCKFAFCLENVRINGYITEKIFDCFQKGIVPIYGGAYNVSDYIPASCFIDYFAFDNLPQLVDCLERMSEETYRQYLNAIEDFLQSESFSYFRIESQMDRVCNAISALPSSFKPNIRSKINMFFLVYCYELRQRILFKLYTVKCKIPILKKLHFRS